MTLTNWNGTIIGPYGVNSDLLRNLINPKYHLIIDNI